MRILTLATIALLACGKDTSTKALCTRGCTKLQACVPNRDSLDSCIEVCFARPPDAARIEALEAKTCVEIRRDIEPDWWMLPTPSSASSH